MSRHNYTWHNQTCHWQIQSFSRRHNGKKLQMSNIKAPWTAIMLRKPQQGCTRTQAPSLCADKKNGKASKWHRLDSSEANSQNEAEVPIKRKLGAVKAAWRILPRTDPRNPESTLSERDESGERWAVDREMPIVRLSRLLFLRAVGPIHQEDGKLALSSWCLNEIHPSRRNKHWFTPVLIWYIGECMVSNQHQYNDIKEHVRGFQNFKVGKWKTMIVTFVYI